MLRVGRRVSSSPRGLSRNVSDSPFSLRGGNTGNKLYPVGDTHGNGFLLT